MRRRGGNEGYCGLSVPLEKSLLFFGKRMQAFSTKVYIYSTSCQVKKSNKQKRYDEDEESGTRQVDPNKGPAKWFVSVICYVI